MQSAEYKEEEVNMLLPIYLLFQSLHLSQVITKCIWTNALSSSAVSATTHKRPVHPTPSQEFPLLRSNLEGTADKSKILIKIMA